MAPKKRSASASELKQAGNESFKNGQYGQAASLYTEAIRLLEEKGAKNTEELSILYSNRAACYLKDGNCNECIKDCTVALKLVPFGIKSLMRRAAAYDALERYRLAYVDYKTALQADSTIQAAHDGANRMTKALIEQDGPDWRDKLPPIPTVPLSAQKRWEPPSGINVGAAGDRNKVSTVQQNETAPTVKAIEQAKLLKEEGNALVKKREYGKAIERYSESLKLNSKEHTTYTNSYRALCYLSLKQYQDAVKDCTEALRLDSGNVKAFYRRAQALKEMKDYKTGIADLHTLLKIEPKNSAAQKLLQELNRLVKQQNK
uniref:Translocase of outer mitochondrial membrane 34 n=1 Tax=Latimeria chalumnae TaxID=7897 RepID=H3A8Q6_LATCH